MEPDDLISLSRNPLRARRRGDRVKRRDFITLIGGAAVSITGQAASPESADQFSQDIAPLPAAKPLPARRRMIGKLSAWVLPSSVSGLSFGGLAVPCGA